MENYTIQRADNGWIISWWDDLGEGMLQHNQVFEVPSNIDTTKEDPLALIDLLYFVKGEVCGQCFSKHKKKNVTIQFQEGEE